jgi:hypothetical protein
MCLFCRHKYKIIKQIDVYEDGFWHYVRTGKKETDYLPIYHKIVLQCEKCGKIKVKKV